MEMTSKSWYKSKTIWFNLISSAVVFTDGMSNLLTGMYDVIPADAYPWYMFSVGMVNLFLRSITSSSLLK